MASKKIKVESLDEIVFEKRNKAYGAYFLRRIYKKHVSISLIISTIVIVGGLTVPLIASYMNKSKIIIEDKTVGVKLENLKAPDEAPPPPPPPPPPEALAQQVKFVAPKVVEDTVEETGMMVQDELSQTVTNVAPSDEEIVVEDNSKNQVIEEAPPQEIFTVVEEQPGFPGGDEARIQFLHENIKYPQLAKESGIQGTVYVNFVVEPDGSVSNVTVLRGIGGGCDEEAVRVVKAMPKWAPGKQRGRPVRVSFNMPIKFTLQG